MGCYNSLLFGCNWQTGKTGLVVCDCMQIQYVYEEK